MRRVARRVLNGVCRAWPGGIEWRFMNAARRGLPRLLPRAGVPGVQLAFQIADRPTCLLSIGVESVRTRVVMTDQSVWPIASLSKPVVAAAMLAGAAAGRFDVLGPLGPTVDDVVAPAERDRVRGLSIADLLAHKSGLGPVQSCFLAAGRVAGVWEILSGAMGAEWTPRSLEHGPAYAGVNYTLAQLAVERRTEREFGRLLDEFVSRKLGLHATRMGGPTLAGTVEFHPVSGAPADDSWTPCAGSGMLSTSGELAAVVHAVMADAGGAGILMPPSMARLMLGPLDAEYTRGFHVRSECAVLDHGGVRPGMRGVVMVAPGSRACLVILANGENALDVIRPLSGLFVELAGGGRGRLAG